MFSYSQTTVILCDIYLLHSDGNGTEKSSSAFSFEDNRKQWSKNTFAIAESGPSRKNEWQDSSSSGSSEFYLTCALLTRIEFSFARGYERE